MPSLLKLDRSLPIVNLHMSGEVSPPCEHLLVVVMEMVLLPPLHFHYPGREQLRQLSGRRVHLIIFFLDSLVQSVVKSALYGEKGAHYNFFIYQCIFNLNCQLR